MGGQVQGGGDVVVEVLKTRCGCHPETCCCGDYTLWLNGKAVAKGFRDKMQAIADAINAKPAPPSAPMGVEAKLHELADELWLAHEKEDDLKAGIAFGDASGRVRALAEALAQQPAAVDGVK